MNDDELLRAKALSRSMNMSEATFYKYKRLGYTMEFGNLTTRGHFKAWLREYHAKKHQEEQADLTAAIGRLS